MRFTLKCVAFIPGSDLLSKKPTVHHKSISLAMELTLMTALFLTV